MVGPHNQSKLFSWFNHGGHFSYLRRFILFPFEREQIKFVKYLLSIISSTHCESTSYEIIKKYNVLHFNKQDEKPDMFIGNFQSPGKTFISLMLNSSISSDYIPNY
jgi:hypothetical protein